VTPGTRLLRSSIPNGQVQRLDIAGHHGERHVDKENVRQQRYASQYDGGRSGHHRSHTTEPRSQDSHTGCFTPADLLIDLVDQQAYIAWWLAE
jgi:hypothetical protein